MLLEIELAPISEDADEDANSSCMFLLIFRTYWLGVTPRIP